MGDFRDATDMELDAYAEMRGKRGRQYAAAQVPARMLVAELEADNERLREALERVRVDMDGNIALCRISGLGPTTEQVVRAALKIERPKLPFHYMKRGL